MSNSLGTALRSRDQVMVRRSSTQVDSDGDLSSTMFVLERDGTNLYVNRLRGLGGSPGTVTSVDARVGDVDLSDRYSPRTGGLVLVADGGTIGVEQRLVAALGSTITLPDAESFGEGNRLSVSPIGGDLTISPAGSDSFFVNSATFRQGTVVTLYPVDIAGLVGSPTPVWNWALADLSGPEVSLPTWFGQGVADGQVVKMVGGVPGWADDNDTVYVPPHFPVGRVYDVTDPQFAGGATGDGITDDTEAFEAACAAAALLPGTIFVPAVDVDAGRFYRIRRRIVVPSWSTLNGQGLASVIRKDSTVSARVSGVTGGGVTSLTVDDASALNVGDEVTISEPVGNFEWNSSHAVITDITGNTLTLDRPTISPYTDAWVLTCFPLVTNNIGHTNDPADSTNGARVQHLCLDQNFGGDDFTDVEFVDFTNSVIHWEHAFDHVVHDVHILNAAGDAYSDQYRGPDSTPGYGYPTSNAILGSHIHNGVRHGIHIGSDTASAQIVGNRVQDCGYMGVLLCRNAQNSVISGNTFVNCRAGVSGSDVRQADDDAVTDATPYGDIRGDIGTVVTGNTFLGGPNSDNVGTLPAIDLGAQGVAVGNAIMDWNGGIRVVADAVDCTVTGNTITLAPNYSGGTGIIVLDGAHRCSVLGNTIRGGGHGDAPVAKQDTGILIDSADDVTIIGNHIANTTAAIFIAGDMAGLNLAHNTTTDITDATGVLGLVRIFGTLTDSSIDTSSFDPAYNAISYHDNAAGSAALGEAAQARLLVNGLGDNGSDDPSAAGEWATVTAQRYDGVIVKWNDGTQRASQFHHGYGWVALGAAAPTVDLTEWHVIYDEVLAAPGLFSGDGNIYTDADLSEYDEIEVSLVGRGASTDASSCGVRMRFNGDVGLNYLLGLSGTDSAAWSNNGLMPTSLTNTNRRGLWKCHIALGHTSSWTIGDWENVYVTSTATSGSAKGQGSVYYTNLGAAISSFELYDSLGDGWAAGTRLTVKGRKLPA